MKNNNINQLDHLFRQGLGDAETGPPSASWAQMEALLDAQPKQKKRAAAWWWAAAAAVIPLFLIGIWWITKPQGIDSQVADVKPISTEQTVPSTKEATPKTNLAETTTKPETANSIASSSHRNPNPSPKQKATVTHLKDLENQSLATNPSIEKVNPEPKIVGIEPPMPPSDELVHAKVKATDNQDDNGIASIEFKTGKPVDNGEGEIASLEFKPNHTKRPTFSEQINKFRNGEINLPTIGDAKQNLFALLSHK